MDTRATMTIDETIELLLNASEPTDPEPCIVCRAEDNRGCCEFGRSR
jgi:hypothetical protein